LLGLLHSVTFAAIAYTSCAANSVHKFAPPPPQAQCLLRGGVVIGTAGAGNPRVVGVSHSAAQLVKDKRFFNSPEFGESPLSAAASLRRIDQAWLSESSFGFNSLEAGATSATTCFGRIDDFVGIISCFIKHWFSP
jgi:hypothetical protein